MHGSTHRSDGAPMNDKKPGIFRRIFNIIGAILTGIRYLVSLFILLFLLVIIFGTFKEDIQPIPDKGALILAPSGILVDQKTYTDPISQSLFQSDERDAETLVRDLVEAIDAAKEDQRVTHILLNTNYLAGGGISKLEEIGRSLNRFRESGKPIIAIGDNFTQQQYYLAAHADEVILNPLGSVLITGFDAHNNYFKDALDKLKINVNVFKAGKYKDAVEPWLQNSMSEESREGTQALIDSLWHFYTTRIEKLRGLPNGAINDLTNNLHTKLQAVKGDFGQLALNTGLVDRLATRTEIKTYLEGKLPSNNGELSRINLRAYLNHLRLLNVDSSNSQQGKIALVIAKGTILEGKQPEGTIGSDSLATVFSKIKEDQTINAVVLRLDTPGGSAFASDVIRDAISAVRAKGIPVVISMGSVAASGGYWIAAESDHIVAMPTTLTGSIGVFGLIPTFEDSLRSLGIHTDGVSTTNLSGIFRLDRPMSPQAKMIFQSGVDNTYDRFLSLVAKARNSSPDAIHEVAQGRVWTGEKALELGLVDQLGDLNDALAAAAELAELSDYQIDLRRKPMNIYERLLMEMTSSASANVLSLGVDYLIPRNLRQQAEQLKRPLQSLGMLTDPRGIYLYCTDCQL